MKFECEKTLMASAIDGVSRAITNRAAIPVLEGIYMKAEGRLNAMCLCPVKLYLTQNC